MDIGLAGREQGFEQLLPRRKTGFRTSHACGRNSCSYNVTIIPKLSNHGGPIDDGIIICYIYMLVTYFLLGFYNTVFILISYYICNCAVAHLVNLIKLIVFYKFV
ncbi:unnamed protein product [Nezara viridula]|uniref:Uncharacterized protein n=1 Tax=Nezara viridula TaxID=85310 RepID=A0A9P0H892_NEZVI|nr:unnamed protein product [Nezara viridula]